MQTIRLKFSGDRLLRWGILGCAFWICVLCITSTASASDPSQAPQRQAVPDCDCSVTCEKYTNDVQGLVTLAPGTPITWTYVIRAGNEDIAGISLQDDQFGRVTCGQSSLNGNTSMTCTASGVAQDLNGGTYVNVATVRAKHADHDDITCYGTCSGSYNNPEICRPGIALEKHTNGVDADTPTGPYIPVGAPVTWSYQVFNVGQGQGATLTNVDVTDNQLGHICTIARIPVGESRFCLRENGQAQLGQYANSATAQGTACGEAVEATDPSHYYGYELAIDIEKSCNGADADTQPGPLTTLGLSLEFVYTVTNESSVTLNDVTVVDDNLGEICREPTLTAGAVMTCTATTTPQDDGQYANLATASGCASSPAQGCVSASDASHCFLRMPRVEIEKSGLPWIYRVSNDGDENLTGVTLSGQDTPVGPVRCGDGQAGPMLLIGDSWCYEAIAPTRGGFGGSAMVTAQGESSALGVQDELGEIPYPEFTLTVKLNGETTTDTTPLGVKAGEPLAWEYVITNDTPHTVTDVALWHTCIAAGADFVLVCDASSLAPGATLECAEAGSATDAAVTCIGSAAATLPDGIPGLTEHGAAEPLSVDALSHYDGWRTGTVGGHVFLDMPPENHILDPADRVLAGVPVRLMNGGGMVAQTTTNMTGDYLFADVIPGEYYVEVDGGPWSLKHESPNRCLDSDVDPDGKTDLFTVESGEDQRCLDAGAPLQQRVFLPCMNQ